jgi:very-short-patch-repair endonuclease
MTKVYNKPETKKRRKYLRKNMPRSEVIIWNQLKKKQRLNQRFLRQYSVENYILDFFCPALKLAIEIDGDSHFINDKNRKLDIERENRLKKYGISVIRFANNDIHNSLNSVVLMIEETINNLFIKQNPPFPPLVKGG